MKSYRMNFAIRHEGRNNASKGIIRSIGFHEHGIVRGPVSEHRSLHEELLKRSKHGISLSAPIP